MGGPLPISWRPEYNPKADHHPEQESILSAWHSLNWDISFFPAYGLNLKHLESVGLQTRTTPSTLLVLKPLDPDYNYNSFSLSVYQAFGFKLELPFSLSLCFSEESGFIHHPLTLLLSLQRPSNWPQDFFYTFFPLPAIAIPISLFCFILFVELTIIRDYSIFYLPANKNYLLSLECNCPEGRTLLWHCWNFGT